MWRMVDDWLVIVGLVCKGMMSFFVRTWPGDFILTVAG